jgi:hypothetical protein
MCVCVCVRVRNFSLGTLSEIKGNFMRVSVRVHVYGNWNLECECKISQILHASVKYSWTFNRLVWNLGSFYVYVFAQAETVGVNIKFCKFVVGLYSQRKPRFGIVDNPVRNWRKLIVTPTGSIPVHTHKIHPIFLLGSLHVCIKIKAAGVILKFCKFHFGENFLAYPSLLTGSEWPCCRGLGKYFTTQNKASQSIMASKATET